MPLACELPSSTQTHLRSVPFVDMVPEQQRDIKIGMIKTSMCAIKDSWHFFLAKVAGMEGIWVGSEEIPEAPKDVHLNAHEPARL